jgi:hypothetical protein
MTTRRMAVAALALCLLAPAAGAQDATPQLSGEAAKKSEPGKAVVALITAARAKDKAKVRALLLPEVQKDLDAEGPAVMELIATMADDAISQITIDMVGADEAKGRVGKKMGATSESTGMTIKRVGGAWKISL